MCEYCRNIDTGDDYNPIIAEEIDLGLPGIIMIDAVLQRNSQQEPCLGVCSCMNCNDNTKEKLIKIKYCPMCGREF